MKMGGRNADAHRRKAPKPPYMERFPPFSLALASFGLNGGSLLVSHRAVVVIVHVVGSCFAFVLVVPRSRWFRLSSLFG